jgi:trehalose synthase
VLQEVAIGQKSLADYASIVGRETMDRIRELAEPLKGKRVLHVSATAFGGGVSEILYTIVPLMRDVGLDAHWHVIFGKEEFFNASRSPTSSGRSSTRSTRSTPTGWKASGTR